MSSITVGVSCFGRITASTEVPSSTCARAPSGESVRSSVPNSLTTAPVLSCVKYSSEKERKSTFALWIAGISAISSSMPTATE